MEGQCLWSSMRTTWVRVFGRGDAKKCRVCFECGLHIFQVRQRRCPLPVRQFHKPKPQSFLCYKNEEKYLKKALYIRSNDTRDALEHRRGMDECGV
eukprot:9495076-Pyramimonas_sp.AAC.1